MCVRVTDDDGGRGHGCAPSEVVVVDPSAGFVTGGGAVEVPAAGPASFGFTVKYLRGRAVPRGALQLRVRGGADFHAEHVDWLVVEGSGATFAGTGRLDGVAGLPFRATVVDGSPDRFRLRVWDGSTLRLDTEPGADAGSTAPLRRGSIVLHDRPARTADSARHDC